MLLTVTLCLQHSLTTYGSQRFFEGGEAAVVSKGLEERAMSPYASKHCHHMREVTGLKIHTRGASRYWDMWSKTFCACSAAETTWKASPTSSRSSSTVEIRSTISAASRAVSQRS